MKICQCVAPVTCHPKCTQEDEGAGLCAACQLCWELAGECALPPKEVAVTEEPDGNREDVPHSVIERVVEDQFG